MSRRKKKPVVPAGSRSTAPGRGAGAPQRPSRQLAGKRKANELASWGDSFEPAKRHPTPGAGCEPQGQQGSGPKRYPEQGFEASHTASGIPLGPDFQRNPPHPSLPYSVETSSSDSVLKPGKDPALHPSYWPISLLDTIGKFLKRYY